MNGEQMTELGQSATQIHEFYSALRHAGFGSDQACYLVVAMAVKNPGTAPAGVTAEKLDRVADSVWGDGGA